MIFNLPFKLFIKLPFQTSNITTGNNSYRACPDFSGSSGLRLDVSGSRQHFLHIRFNFRYS